MMTRPWIGLALFASTAHAELPATELAKRGYKTPTEILATSTARVAIAKKAGKLRVVLVTAGDKIVDGGVVRPGVLAATQPADLVAPGLVIVELAYTKTSANERSERASSLWFVRESGTTACTIPKDQTTSIGSQCGSSGWTSAKVALTPDARGTIVDVQYESSGNYSVSDSNGDCLNRSPVRRTSTARWLIGSTGTCRPATP